MNEDAQEAARIIRKWKPKTMGEIFNVAKGEALNNPRGSFLGDDDANAHGWAVVDAHYAKLRDVEYRAAAGLEPMIPAQREGHKNA